MSTPLQISKIDKCIEVLGHIEGPSIHNILSRIEFWLATNLKDQLEYIKKACPEFSVRVVIKLLEIPNNRYYGSFKNQEISIEKLLPPPSRQLLLETEENWIIQFIASKLKTTV